MKANAVNDVMQHVAKIQDHVERLEVARAVAAAFKIPESVIFERLNVAPRSPEVRPGSRITARIADQRRLSLAEKQLIQALMQDSTIASALQPFLKGDFLFGIWSGPVLQQLIKDPTQNIERALETVQDDDLKREVRTTVLEPFGPISEEQAIDSVKQLYGVHLVKKIEELHEQLKQYGSGPAPADLVRKHMEIVAEKSRIGAFKA
jgi:hypothetical protein